MFFTFYRSCIGIILGVLCISIPLQTLAFTPALSERIQEFHSDITVHENGSFTITETIRVVAAGDEIKHGIYRDFPTIYPHPWSSLFRTTVPFTVERVTKNGQEEPFFMSSLWNGKRLYIGEESVFLDSGEYTYTITYSTDKQLYFGESYDELLWNVTGNGWIFPIDHASATVHLPSSVTAQEIHKTGGFTGAQGSVDTNMVAEKDAQGNLTFHTTQMLSAQEGLTILVQWKKGFVHSPTTAAWIQAVYDNPEIPIAVVAVLYYLFAWFAVGRDPKKSTIIPQYEPPQNLSPAAIQYLMSMSVSLQKTGVAAAIINMGVKGWITLSHDKELIGHHYTLHKKERKNKQPLSTEEQVLFDALFAEKDTIELVKGSYATVGPAINKFSHLLYTQYKKGNFKLHFLPWFFGLFLIACVGVAPFLLFHSVTVGGVIIIIFLVIVSIIFYKLLKAPSIAGQKLRSEIEGFKWFLSVTEKDRLAFEHPPKKTPQLFERFLPYALALGVENKWAEQFADVFAAMEKAGQNAGMSWYTGANFAMFAHGGFASSLGSSLTSNISSASTAPSSGGSGGGFSGGGGGGGGGGGW